VPLGELLTDSTGLAVFVENDVNALAVHEQWFGDGVNVRNFGVIFVGEGVGAGLVLDGTLYHGRSGLAGEIGHAVVKRGGRGCGCGGYGHLESYASTHAIVDMVIQLGAEIVDGFDLEAAAMLAETDRRYRAPFREAGDALGQAIATLLTTNNLERLIITGPACLVESEGIAGFMFRQAVQNTAGELAFDSAVRDCSLMWRATRTDYGAHGAASTVLREFIQRPLAWEGRISERSEVVG
jgi:predicted NBD/HSP70 family sugar kinase